jgi:hypothetical protein
MRELTLDISKRLDIRARKNQAIDKTFAVKNPDGTGFDFTDYTATMEVFTGPSDTVPNLTFTVTLATGELRIQLAANKIKRNSTYIYFLKLNGILWLNGRFIINEGLYEQGESTESLVINSEGTPITITISAGTGTSTITGSNGIDVTNGVATLGSPMTKNTTILGELFNLIFGTPESRFNQFLFRVAGLFEVLMPSGGAWRAVVGTAQAIIGGNSIAFLHDLIIEFTRPGSESSVLEIVTEEGNEQVRSNVPVVLKQVNSQAELDALDPEQYVGSLVYKNFSTGIQQPQPAYSNGLWKTIRQIVSISTDIVNAVVFGTGVPVHRIIIGQDVSEPGYYYESTLALELMSNTAFTLICTADFSSGDQQIMSINRNAQGTYIVTTKINLMIEEDTPTWLISVHVAGPADISQTGHLIVSKDPSEFFDIFFTGTIASNNQLYHRFNTLKISTAE